MSKTVFLGVEGSGKTTLTMALAKAFESHKNEDWYLKPLSRDSFRFLKTLPDTLGARVLGVVLFIVLILLGTHLAKIAGHILLGYIVGFAGLGLLRVLWHVRR